MSEETPRECALYIYDAGINRVALISNRIAQQAQLVGSQQGHDAPFDVVILEDGSWLKDPAAETAPVARRILCHTMVWKHRSRPSAWTVRIKNPADVETYLKAWPHLALSAATPKQ